MKRLNEAANAELMLLAGGTPFSLLPAEVVLLHAENETSALHPFFEWDDSEAAHEYRLSQARELIRMAVTVMPGANEPVRALVSLSCDRAQGGGYRRIHDVLNDPQQRAVMLQDALSELRMIERKYRQLTELSELWQRVDEIDKTITGNEDRRTAA